MKNWSMFKWAFKRLKMSNGRIVKCARNDILLRVVHLSGVRPSDVNKVLRNYHKSKTT